MRPATKDWNLNGSDLTIEPPRADLFEILASGTPPAFAIDEQDRIIFWNRGMADLLDLSEDRALGCRCFELTGGRDVFGNVFCSADCPVVAMTRRREAIRGFEMDLKAAGGRSQRVSVTVLPVRNGSGREWTLVHLIEPVDPSRRLAWDIGRMPAEPERPTGSTVKVRAHSVPRLTQREHEVLERVAAGMQNKEIADDLGISVATARNHVRNVQEKLGVHSKLELVSLAFRKGWVQRAGRGTSRGIPEH